MVLRIALAVVGTILLAVIVWYIATGGPFRPWVQQMRAGAAYMKSLKDSDMPPWIERTKRLLAEWHPRLRPIGAYGLGGKPIPPDLQQLKIIRVDILQDQVRYVWMGGMDHTELEVDRLPDGGFRFVAHYNEYKSEVIWPKRPKQALQPTPQAVALLLLVPSLCYEASPSASWLNFISLDDARRTQH